MAERKVLTKYYPPDFDPSQIKRSHAAKGAGPKTQTVRLMAPFSMMCLACGDWVNKGRKFNARKETSNERYLNIQIIRFYIRCPRCSSEITFKTDPQNMDYICESGARRNFEAWREDRPEESLEERLDRLEREERGEEDRDAMLELETKAQELRSEEKIGDALDSIRIRNAERERALQDGFNVVKARENDNGQAENDDEQDTRDAQLAKEMFQKKRLLEDAPGVSKGQPDANTNDRLWKVAKKPKKSHRASLLPGIVRKLEPSSR